MCSSITLLCSEDQKLNSTFCTLQITADGGPFLEDKNEGYSALYYQILLKDTRKFGELYVFVSLNLIKEA
jgi:hypothetical protein